MDRQAGIGLLKPKKYPATQATYKHKPQRPQRIQWVDKYALAPGLLLTTALISVLLTLDIMQWRGPESFAAYVLSSPTQIAITVQIISHLLGLLQVQALCAILRCSFVTSTTRKGFSLSTVQWVQAASTPRLSFTLPWFLCLALVVPVVLSLLPGAIWSGCITPILSSKSVTQTIQISTFQSNNVSSLFQNPPNQTQSLLVNTKGLFSFDPAALRGPILSSASDASMTNTTTSLHQKLDKTTYQYNGRSYGVASAVGLVDDSLANRLWYRYNETGFTSNVTCIRNVSKNFNVDLRGSSTIFIVSTGGKGPTNEDMLGAWYTGWTLHDLFGWGVSYSSLAATNHTIFLQLWTTARPGDDQWAFADFNATQCRIDFVPRVFDVVVNNTDKIITATPYVGDTLEWPNYSAAVLRDGVADWLHGLTLTDTGFGGSQVGRSLRANVNQLMAGTGKTDTATIMKGIEDHVESVVDNVLVTLSSARTMILDQKQQVQAEAGHIAAVFGDHRNIVVMFVFNTLVCFVYIFEACRTRLWRDMSALDLTNFGAVVIGALRGGAYLSPESTSLAGRNAKVACVDKAFEDYVVGNGVRLEVRDGTSKCPVLHLAEDLERQPQRVPMTILPSPTRDRYVAARGDGTFEYCGQRGG